MRRGAVSGKFGFDTFLTNLPEMPSAGTAPTAAQSRRSPNSGVSGSSAAATPQPIDILLRALDKQPTMTMRQMTPLLSGSIDLVLDTVDKLVALGYATRGSGDQVLITADGADAAKSLAYK
jgi:hypothetical protein